MTRRDRRTRRDVHALDPDGNVACNPRDREARHRAAVGDLLTAPLPDVTCPRCIDRIHRLRRERPAAGS